MRRELPDEWKTICERVGVASSFRGIASASGLAITTVQRLISEGRTSTATVLAVANALRLDPDEVKRMAGVGNGRPTWYPTPEAQHLSPEVHEALDDLIRAIARQGGSNDDRQSEAEKSPHLHADDQDRVTLAARRIHGPKGIIDPSQETAGEENQDPGGWDEA